MTNKEWLFTLSAETCWIVLDWVMHKYGKCYIDTAVAVIEWLDKPFDLEQMRNDFEKWHIRIEI